MAKTIAAWLADDGTIHKTEEEAKNYDFEQAFGAWWTGLGLDIADPVIVKSCIFGDRQKLLAIFKLLNGGPTLQPPLPAGRVVAREIAVGGTETGRVMHLGERLLRPESPDIHPNRYEYGPGERAE